MPTVPEVAETTIGIAVDTPPGPFALPTRTLPSPLRLVRATISVPAGSPVNAILVCGATAAFAAAILARLPVVLVEFVVVAVARHATHGANREVQLGYGGRGADQTRFALVVTRANAFAGFTRALCAALAARARHAGTPGSARAT